MCLRTYVIFRTIIRMTFYSLVAPNFKMCNGSKLKSRLIIPNDFSSCRFLSSQCMPTRSIFRNHQLSFHVCGSNLRILDVAIYIISNNIDMAKTWRRTNRSGVAAMNESGMTLL